MHLVQNVCVKNVNGNDVKRFCTHPNRDWLLTQTYHYTIRLQNVTMKYQFRYVLCTLE